MQIRENTSFLWFNENNGFQSAVVLLNFNIKVSKIETYFVFLMFLKHILNQCY